MRGADIDTALGSRGFHRALSQVIDGSGSPSASLDSEVHRLRLERARVNAGATQAVFDILATLLAIERSQLQAVSQPAAQRRMNSELEAGQKPVVTNQHQTEGNLIKLRTGKQTQFFKRRRREILRLFDDQHRPATSQALPGFSDRGDVVAAPELWPDFEREAQGS